MYARPKYNMLKVMIEYLSEEGFCRPFEKLPKGFLDKTTGKEYARDEVSICRSLYFSDDRDLSGNSVIHAIRTSDGVWGWCAGTEVFPPVAENLHFKPGAWS